MEFLSGIVFIRESGIEDGPDYIYVSVSHPILSSFLNRPSRRKCPQLTHPYQRWLIPRSLLLDSSAYASLNYTLAFIYHTEQCFVPRTMSTTDSSPISLTVSFRGKPHVLSLLPDATLAALHSRLEELTEVPPHLQKLLYKGKKALGETDAGEITLVQAGLKDGTKVQMLGTTTKDLDGMKAVENENQRRERIMRERALKAPVKVCFYRFSLASRMVT